MNRPRTTRRRPATAGFTLLELVVAMGLLSAFLMLLVQLLGSGVGVFEDGERGQDIADRAMAASRAVTASLDDMVGPARLAYEPAPPSARLLVTWAPLGLDRARPGAARTQVVRSTVRLDEERERRLLEELLRPTAEEEAGSGGEAAVARRLAELVAEKERRGRGEMLLLPWPAAAAGAILELRRGVFLADWRYEDMGLMDLDLGGGDLPPVLVPEITEVVATGVLHVEFDLWSQETGSWISPPEHGGPQRVWDSARAGRLAEADDPEQRFSLDLGPVSLDDARDDVFPRWVRVTLVVARSVSDAPEAFLTEPVGAEAKSMVLNRTELLPTDAPARFVKVGTEWIAFAGVAGRELTGLKRGERGTVAQAHAAGAEVRVGRTVVLYQKLLHGRDG